MAEAKPRRASSQQRRPSELLQHSAPSVKAPPQQIGNYDYVRSIGEGSFAKVKMAVHRLTGEKVAIKIIDKDALPDTYSLTHLHREAQIMRMLDHPNIVQLIEVMETKRELHLVLEYASGGEVLDYIVAHERLKESEARKFFYEVVSALDYCHQRNIVHRDLKAENLLLDGDMHIKISDFGLSNTFDRSKQLSTCCGSPVYSAPELIEGRKYIGPEVDMWSLGVNLYAMVVGDLPFVEKDLKKLYEKILSGRYYVPNYVSGECRDLISKLLVLNPAKRYTAAQVLEHGWMKELISTRSFAWEHAHEQSSANKSAHGYMRPQNIPELDTEILQQMTTYNYESNAARQDILGGKFNQAAGTYYLLALKKRKVAMAARKRANELGREGPDAAGSTAVHAQKSARATDNVTSDELATVLIKAERTRVITRINQEAGQLLPSPPKIRKSRRDGLSGTQEHEEIPALARPPSRPRPRGGAAADAALPVPLRTSKGSRLGIESQDETPYVGPSKEYMARGRRHSFSPGELILPGAPLSRNQSNQGLDPRALGSKHSEVGRSRSISQEVPKPPVRHASITLPPISTAHDSTHIVAAQHNGNSNHIARGSRASITSVANLPTHISKDALRSVETGPLLSPSPPLQPMPSNTTHLRSHRPRSNTIQIDESLYMPSSETGREDPSPDDTQPRTIRFAFNCTTTSDMPYATVFSRLIETLATAGVSYVVEGFLCECELGDIRFEAEICKLPRLLMYGIRLKRISGDMWEYKRICQTITESLDI
ncbi:MAP microtubule affinity-regulating kinase 1 [Thoreauomyces humboldtii]|nr:MAP microtubule affinity-regulating kinase 1 [Thoreauomyces humboldtii]